MTPRFRVAFLGCLSLTAGGAFAAPAGTVAISPVVREHLTYFDFDSAEPVDVIVTLAAEPAGVAEAKAKERGAGAGL